MIGLILNVWNHPAVSAAFVHPSAVIQLSENIAPPFDILLLN